MPRPLAALAAALFLLAPSTGAVVADEPVQLAQSDTSVDRVFNDLERRVIREVLGAAGVPDIETETRRGGKKTKRSKGGPPGLSRRGSLPPGLQRQLERNGRLPPGLEKQQFPSELRGRLPSPLQGTERVIIGNDAVLIDLATNVILDVIRDVVGNGK